MGLVKCCREQVVAVSPDTPAVEVARVMGEKNVGSVVIVSGDNRPVGVITARDLTVRVMAQERNPGEVRAGDIVTRDVITFRDSMGVYEAIQKMSRGHQADAGRRRRREDVIVTMHDIAGCRVRWPLLQRTRETKPLTPSSAPIPM